MPSSFFTSDIAAIAFVKTVASFKLSTCSTCGSVPGGPCIIIWCMPGDIVIVSNPSPFSTYNAQTLNKEKYRNMSKMWNSTQNWIFAFVFRIVYLWKREIERWLFYLCICDTITIRHQTVWRNKIHGFNSTKKWKINE